MAALGDASARTNTSRASCVPPAGKRRRPTRCEPRAAHLSLSLADAASEDVWRRDTGRARCTGKADRALPWHNCAPEGGGLGAMSTRKRFAKQRVLRQLEELIARHGVAVITVGPARDAPSFSYTVGLSDDGLPELLVLGLPAEVAQPVLNTLAARLRREGALRLNEPLTDVFAGTTAVLHEVPLARSAPYVRVAAHRRAGVLRVLQLIWPDAAGRFPWQAGCEPSFLAAQPLLSADRALPAGQYAQ